MARTPGTTETVFKATQSKLSRALHDVNETAAAQMPDTEQLMAQLNEARETIRELSARLGQTARDVGDSATAAFASASEKVSHAASDVSDRASAAAHTAAEGVDAVGTEIETFTRKNPVVALTAAVGLGLLIGLAARGRK